MEIRWVFWISLSILIVSVLTSFLISSKLTQASPAEEVLEDCKTLYDNGIGKINLVFFSDKETTKKYADFLLETPPLKDNKDSFNVFYIDDYKLDCEIYKGVAVLCYNKEIIKKAASCPNDFIFAITDNPSNIRSSTYRNVVSINKNLPLTVLTHEFGHVFSNFAEEYVEEGAKIPKGSQNCQQQCSDFEGTKNGCYEGCTSSTYKRSIENGVMRTLSSNDFGTFDENLILQKIEKSITEKSSSITGSVIFSPNQCSEKSYSLIEATYKDGDINILGKTQQQGCFPEIGAEQFSYQTQSKGKITKGNFNPELIFTDIQLPGDEILSGESLDPEGVSFFLQVPLDSNTLTVSDENGQEFFSQNIANTGAEPCIA